MKDIWNNFNFKLIFMKHAEWEKVVGIHQKQPENTGENRGYFHYMTIKIWAYWDKFMQKDLISQKGRKRRKIKIFRLN